MLQTRLHWRDRHLAFSFLLHLFDKTLFFLSYASQVINGQISQESLLFIQNCKEILWEKAVIWHDVPRLSSTKIGLQVFILSSGFSIFSIYKLDGLKSLFVLAGNERAVVEVAGGFPDWLEFFRSKKGWTVLKFGVGEWNTRWHRLCSQPGNAHFEYSVYWDKHKVWWFG